MPTETEMELARLRKELAEIKLERDLLKKCVAYFAKDSRGNTNGSNNCDIIDPASK